MKDKIRAIAQQLMDLIGTDSMSKLDPDKDGDPGSDEGSNFDDDTPSKEKSSKGGVSADDEDGAQVTPMPGMKNSLSVKEGATDGSKKHRTMKMMSAMLAGKIKHNQK